MLRGVARPRALGDDLAGDRGRLADAAAARTPHQVDVDVIVVIDVGARREHGAKFLAGRRLHVAQKTLLLRRAVPAILHADLAAVGQFELGDVERVAERVLGNPRIGVAVHSAAGIGGYLLDLDDRLPKPVERGRLHCRRDPLVEPGDERAGQRRRRLDLDRADRSGHHRAARGAEWYVLFGTG